MEKIFETLNKINVSENVEKKGKFSYLSWTCAWAELQKVCPTATYEIVKFDGLPYKENTRGECIVFTKLTINGITHEMWLPVMDNFNKAMKNPDMMTINKAIMRCLVKNIAMFGLGLYIYKGEDLPDEEAEKTTKQPATQEVQQKPVQEKKLTEVEYAKLEDGIKNCQTVNELMKYATTTLINSKSKMSQIQYEKLKTMLDGYKNTLTKAEADKINAKSN